MKNESILENPTNFVVGSVLKVNSGIYKNEKFFIGQISYNTYALIGFKTGKIFSSLSVPTDIRINEGISSRLRDFFPSDIDPDFVEHSFIPLPAHSLVPAEIYFKDNEIFPGMVFSEVVSTNGFTAPGNYLVVEVLENRYKLIEFKYGNIFNLNRNRCLSNRWSDSLIIVDKNKKNHYNILIGVVGINFSRLKVMVKSPEAGGLTNPAKSGRL